MAATDLIVNFIGRDQSLSRVSQQAGNSVKNNLGGAVKAGAAIGTAALAGLGVAVVGTGAKLIGLGSDAEEMLGKFNVVFATTGGRVTAELEAFGAAVGRSKFELQSMASTFGDTLKPLGFAEQQAAGLSIQMTELAADLGSFNDMEMDEALRRLQGTLIGSHENALAFGVIINENTLKAELARQGWDKLTGAQLEQAKVQARINLLMQGTTDAQGDALRTAGSWANQMRGLKATLTDIGTELGQKLLPAITPLLGMIKELALSAVPIVTRVFEALVPVIGFLVDHMNVIGPLIAAVVAGFAAFVILSTVATWISAAIGAFTALSAAVATAGGLLGGLGLLLGPVTIVIAAIAAVVALFAAAWTSNWFGIRDKTAAVVEFMKGLWADIVGGLRIVWEFLETKVFPIFQAVNNFIDAVFNLTLRAMAAIFTTYILPPMQAVADFITAKLGPAFEWLRSHIIEPVRDALRGLGDVFADVTGWFNNMTEKLNNFDVPGLLKPGSPTPFEIGLVGIRNQMSGLARQELPAVATQLQGLNRITNNNRATSITNNIYTNRVDVPRFNQTQSAFANGGI